MGYNVGDQVLLSRERTGVIKFKGKVHFEEGLWFGVELDYGHVGKNDGSFRGEKYFDCRPRSGLFLKEASIQGIAPEEFKSTQEPINQQTKLKMGELVILSDGRVGKIAFMGQVKFARGNWIGLVLEVGHPGKNDGSVKGKRYFKCPQGRGLFVTKKRIQNRIIPASTAEFVLPRSNSSSRGRSKERSDFDGGMFGRSQSLPSPRTPYKHETTAPDLELQRPRSSSVADEMQDNLKFFSRRRANKTKSAAEKVRDFPLRDEAFFHGKMMKKNAEKMLLKKGYYLLRQERSRKIVLSVRRSRNTISHIEIGFDEERSVYYCGSKKKSSYRAFEELVKSVGGRFPVDQKGEAIGEKKKKKKEKKKMKEVLGSAGETTNPINRTVKVTTPTKEAGEVQSDAPSKMEDLPDLPIPGASSEETGESAPIPIQNFPALALADTPSPQLKKPKPSDKKSKKQKKSEKGERKASADEPAPPDWLGRCSAKTQAAMVTYLNKLLLEGGSDRFLTKKIYNAMRSKYKLTKDATEELYKFLIGPVEPNNSRSVDSKPSSSVDIPTSSSSSSPKISKNPTEPTDLMNSEDLLTSEDLLNSEQLEAVEVVFNTLSLDDHGVESVSFRTLLSHYKVDLLNEEIDELFMSISKDGNGFATWATMVEFLRNEIELDPKTMKNHSVLIQAMRKPPKIQRLHSEDTNGGGDDLDDEETTGEAEDKELTDVTRAWLESAKKQLAESRAQIEEFMQSREVPGGYTKADLLEDYDDLFEVSEEELKPLLVKKLQICCVRCEFNDESPSEEVYRQRKLDMLTNISNYVNETKNWFDESVLVAMKEFFIFNIFRPLISTPISVVFDPDEDPNFDPAWEHVSCVYEVLTRTIVSPFVDGKMLVKYLDDEWIVQLVGVFMSEDPRERDYLKIIIHRYYGRFLKPRALIRKTMHDMLYSFIHTPDSVPGVCEILEILGSIINGFSIPLKAEHKDFLRNVLLPLHKARNVVEFSQQIHYCITQFVAKDPGLTSEILSGLLKFWPIQNSQKEVVFLNEVEGILELVEPETFELVTESLFDRLGQCMASPHFQVAEQALNMSASEAISYYIARQRERILPILYPYLQKNLRGHWNDQVRSVTVNILSTLREMDDPLYKKIVLHTKQEQNAQKAAEQKRKLSWAALMNAVPEVEEFTASIEGKPMKVDCSIEDPQPLDVFLQSQKALRISELVHVESKKSAKSPMDVSIKIWNHSKVDIDQALTFSNAINEVILGYLPLDCPGEIWALQACDDELRIFPVKATKDVAMFRVSTLGHFCIFKNGSNSNISFYLHPLKPQINLVLFGKQYRDKISSDIQEIMRKRGKTIAIATGVENFDILWFGEFIGERTDECLHEVSKLKYNGKSIQKSNVLSKDAIQNVQSVSLRWRPRGDFAGWRKAFGPRIQHILYSWNIQFDGI